MSGGQWEYSHLKLREYLEEIGDDKDMVKEFPRLASIMKALSSSLHQVIKDLDWHLSGDTIIHDPKAFEEEAINAIIESLEHFKAGFKKNKITRY